VSENWNPSDNQLACVQGMVGNAGFGALAKPGFGKTSATLAACAILKEANATKGVIVVAPLRPVYKVWPAEIQRWEDFKHLSYEILHGPKKADALRRKADVYIINYEGLAWLEAELAKFKKEKREIPFDVLVLDESTKVKNTKTQRYKILRSIRHLFSRCWILTGTPAPNGIQDLFGQIYMLDMGKRLGKFITHFRREYFDEEPQRGGYSLWYPRKGAKQAIEAKIADITVTFDAPPKPGLSENIIYVDLAPATKKIYKGIEDDFYAQLDSGEVTAVNAAAKSVKLRQITGGGVYGTKGIEYFDDAKVNALLDLIEEQAGQPLLVAVAFQHEVTKIREALGREVPYLGGGMSAAYANQVIDDWNAGKLDVLLVHPSSVAHGLNLQSGGSQLVWFNLTWNAEEYEQTIARVWRQGQKKACVVHFIIADDTIDTRVLDVLRAKIAAQESLLKSLKQRKA
jgi:SNF2 family DNA or RNA helicase